MVIIWQFIEDNSDEKLTIEKKGEILLKEFRGICDEIISGYKEGKEYDSLWEEEEDKDAVEDSAQVADNAEAFAPGPAIEEVADT